jgi:NhaA family Na+:H+ antiporter
MIDVENRSAGPISFIAEFLRLEAAAGFVLMAAAVVALVLANSPVAPLYHAVLSAEIGLPGASLSVLLWINDGLMAIFFLLIGLELKRELLAGELSSTKHAVYPGCRTRGSGGAAVIYAAFNWNGPATLRGWAIPALRPISRLRSASRHAGRRVPTSLKVFLTALAIVDDLARLSHWSFYTEHVSGNGWTGVVGLTPLFVFNWLGIRRLAPYLIVGLLRGARCWLRIHATLAGLRSLS